MEQSRRPGGGVTAFSSNGQAVDKQPGQRQRDGQQQPGPQPGGKKNPHANVLPRSDVSHHLHGATRSAALQSPVPGHAPGRTTPGAWPAQAAAGARYAGLLRQTRIRARTLVLQGAADTVVDPRNGRLLASRIPGAQLVIFPELGHLLFWQEPDGFADVVTLFLLAGAKINKSAPAAVPGTTGHSRPVGEAPHLREDQHHARGEPGTWPTPLCPYRWVWCSPTGRRAR